MASGKLTARLNHVWNAEGMGKSHVATVSLSNPMILTDQSNQWSAPWLYQAIIESTTFEMTRRAMLNEQLVGSSVRLATRQEAVERDLLRAWVGAAVPAGQA